MNQEKIGKFIFTVRKEKKLTQKQLAEKLNITDRAISKWENGKSLPDLSLLKPLCNILDISINELLSGEYLFKKNYDNIVEQNFINAINYSKKRQNISEFIFYLFILLFGSLMLVISMSVFSTPIGFAMWYSIIGTYILMIIFSCLLNKFITNNKSEKHIGILIISFFILYFGYLWTIDFINVKKNNSTPDIFVISTSVTTDSVSYDTLFYDLYICNIKQDDEYRKLVFDINHTVDFNNIQKQCNQ